MKMLVPKSFFDLGEPDLAGQAQVFAVLPCRELGHGRDSLAAGVTGPDSVTLHTAMVSYALPASERAAGRVWSRPPRHGACQTSQFDIS